MRWDSPLIISETWILESRVKGCNHPAKYGENFRFSLYFATANGKFETNYDGKSTQPFGGDTIAFRLEEMAGATQELCEDTLTKY